MLGLANILKGIAYELGAVENKIEEITEHHDKSSKQTATEAREGT